MFHQRIIFHSGTIKNFIEGQNFQFQVIIENEKAYKQTITRLLEIFIFKVLAPIGKSCPSRLSAVMQCHRPQLL